MSDGANVMKALAPGEGASSEEDVTLRFIGREWYVHAYIGTPYNGGALIIGDERQDLDRERIARKFITAACVTLLGDGDASQSLDRLARMLAEQFGEAAHQIARHMAARGKPS